MNGALMAGKPATEAKSNQIIFNSHTQETDIYTEGSNKASALL